MPVKLDHGDVDHGDMETGGVDHGDMETGGVETVKGSAKSSTAIEPAANHYARGDRDYESKDRCSSRTSDECRERSNFSNTVTVLYCWIIAAFELATCCQLGYQYLTQSP